VANQQFNAFSRTFAYRDLFAGLARRAVVWSILAAALLAMLIILLSLLMGVITDPSPLLLNVTQTQLEEFNRFTGMRLRHIGPRFAPARNEEGPPLNPAIPIETPAPDVDQDEPDQPTDGETRRELKMPHVLEGEGILRSVWLSHGRWYGEPFAWIYRRLDFLRHNDVALVVLMTSAVVIALLRAGCLIQVRRCSQQAAQRVAVQFRKNLHRQVLRLSPEDIDEQSARDAVDLFTTHVDAVRDGLENWIYRLARYPWEIACALVFALSVDVLMAIQWAVPLSLCWFLIEQASTRLAAARRLSEDCLKDAYRVLSEQLLNARLVRGFGMEQTEHEEFVRRLERTLSPSKDLYPSQREALWLQRLTVPVCVGLVLFLLLSLGLKLQRGSGELTFTGATAFLISALLTLRGARELWRLRSLREAVSLSADQIFRYLDRLPSVSQAVGAKFLQPLSRSLHFDAVTYRTPSQRVLLDRITLKLDAGKSYAVVSLDPMEAKAFALLLPRFLEPQSGRILFDGEDIAWATLESLRAEAVFVGGDDPPLRGTVLENLRAGNTQFSLPQVTEAAKLTHAHNFLVRLPQGYETVLTGDDELDASQRFRLALTRAVLRNPALLIIEEPKITFDDDAKQLLDDAYERIIAGRTVVFLPSRLTTLKRVDQVILLHNGQVAAMGPQSVLVNESPLYRHWEYLHFNEFRRSEPLAARA
jgi:ABC-type multidrug transport system fused ATPase/permease subunit